MDVRRELYLQKTVADPGGTLGSDERPPKPDAPQSNYNKWQ